MQHQRITAAQPSDSIRAQVLLGDHIASIDAALTAIGNARSQMVPSIVDCHVERLTRFRRLLSRDFTEVTVLPATASIYIRRWNHNAHGWNVEAACKDALSSAARPDARERYAASVAAARGLAVMS